MIYYSPQTRGFYDKRVHTAVPDDAVEISDQEHATLLEGEAQGLVITAGPSGQPMLVAPEIPPVTADQLCASIDAAADAARRAVAGDPLRAVEYDRAASQAKAFADAGYQGEMPPMVAAWAISGRTAQQAADDILREAAQYNGALVQLRATRLQAKALICATMDEGNIEQAQDIAAETIAAIEATVAGIGNNADA